MPTQNTPGYTLTKKMVPMDQPSGSTITSYQTDEKGNEVPGTRKTQPLKTTPISEEEFNSDSPVKKYKAMKKPSTPTMQRSSIPTQQIPWTKS